MNQIGEPRNEIWVQFGRIEERPTDMEGTCESTEKEVADSWQGMTVQLWGSARR